MRFIDKIPFFSRLNGQHEGSENTQNCQIGVGGATYV